MCYRWVTFGPLRPRQVFLGFPELILLLICAFLKLIILEAKTYEVQGLTIDS